VVGLRTIPTPALVVGAWTVERGVRELATRAADAGAALWPHAKTHKSVAVAALQRTHGAAGLTVATLPEAEHFADAGFDDLLLACRSRPVRGAHSLRHALPTLRR
jgi:D-serine deaminase-like pyridoxal phosphate-dependent protein